MEEYLEPRPEDRQKIRLIQASIVIFAVLMALAVILINRHIAELPTCEFISWVIPLLYIPFALGFIVGAWMFRRLWLGMAHAQLPPPGNLIFKRTKVVRGPIAKRRAMLGLALTCIVLVMAVHASLQIGKIKNSFHDCFPGQLHGGGRT